jgi:hypothetical protein
VSEELVHGVRVHKRTVVKLNPHRPNEPSPDMKVRGMAEEAGHNFPGPKAAEFKEQNSALPGSGRTISAIPLEFSHRVRKLPRHEMMLGREDSSAGLPSG